MGGLDRTATHCCPTEEARVRSGDQGPINLRVSATIIVVRPATSQSARSTRQPVGAGERRAALHPLSSVASTGAGASGWAMTATSEGHLPSFLSVTDGKTADVTVARTWTFEAGSGSWPPRLSRFHVVSPVAGPWRHLRDTPQGGVRYRVTREHEVRAGTGILSDQTIELTRARSRKVYPTGCDGLPRPVDKKPLRVRDQQHHVGRQDDRRPVQVPVADRAVFQVDQAASEGETFRGPVEKRGLDATVGGHLHVPAAGLPQVRLRWSLNQMLQVLQLNIFERRPLEDLFTTHSPPDRARPQLALAWA